MTLTLDSDLLTTVCNPHSPRELLVLSHEQTEEAGLESFK